jgi:hypothetical protein
MSRPKDIEIVLVLSESAARLSLACQAIDGLDPSLADVTKDNREFAARLMTIANGIKTAWIEDG